MGKKRKRGEVAFLRREHKKQKIEGAGKKKKNFFFAHFSLSVSLRTTLVRATNRRGMRSSFSSWRRTCSSSSAGGARTARAAVPSASSPPSSSSSAAAVASTSGENEVVFFLRCLARLLFTFSRSLLGLLLDDLDAHSEEQMTSGKLARKKKDAFRSTRQGHTERKKVSRPHLSSFSSHHLFFVVPLFSSLSLLLSLRPRRRGPAPLLTQASPAPQSRRDLRSRRRVGALWKQQPTTRVGLAL